MKYEDPDRGFFGLYEYELGPVLVTIFWEPNPNFPSNHYPEDVVTPPAAAAWFGYSVTLGPGYPRAPVTGITIP